MFLVTFKYRRLYANFDKSLQRTSNTPTRVIAVFLSICILTLITIGIFLPVMSYSQSSDFSNVPPILYAKLTTSVASQSVAPRESSNIAGTHNAVGNNK